MKIKKTVVKSTTKNPVKAEAKAAKPSSKPAQAPVASAKAEDKGTRNGVNIGKSSGMRVMAYQDHTLAINDDPKRRLTDTELAADWRKEFPESRAVKNGRINEDIVRGVRNLYNQGTGGHGTAGKTHTSQPYILADGKRVTSVYTRAKKVGEPVAVVAVPVTVKAKGPKVVKGKVVVRRQKAA